MPAKIRSKLIVVFCLALATAFLGLWLEAIPTAASPNPTVEALDAPSDLSNGLIGRWSFDDGTDPTNDDSGHGHDGDLINGPAFTTTVPAQLGSGLALAFDDVDDYVLVGGDEADFDLTTLTVAFWFKTPGFTNGYEGLVTKGDSAWRVHRDEDTSNIEFAISRASGGISSIATTGVITDDVWHHYAVTYDGATAKVYLDGALNKSGSFNAVIDTNDYSVTIGTNGQIMSRYFNGLMDDVRIYNRAISEDDIAQLYSNTPDQCFVETTGDQSTDYSSIDASAVQTAIDAADPGDLLKIAGTCAGVQETAGITQTVYISQNLTLQGGYTITNWLATPNPETYPTILDALNNGRVIYITPDVTVTLDSLTLQNGRIDGTNAYGGGIYAGGSLTLTNSLLQHNYAEHGGGGLYADSTGGGVLIRNTHIYSNTGWNNDGGGGLYATQPITVVNSLIDHNRTSEYGGGAAFAYTTVLISNTDILSNTNTEYEGGGLWFTDSQVTIRASRVLSNVAWLRPGGGVYDDGGSSLSIIESEIGYNISGLSGIDGVGGGIMMNNVGDLFLDNSFVHHNSASTDGGGIFSDRSVITITQSTIADNTASDGYGGGMYYSDGMKMTITDSTISGNTADDGYGGGIYNSGNLTITGSTITDNQIIYVGSSYDGGGIYNSGNLTVANSTFYSNTAYGYGGGIYNVSGKIATLINNTFASDSADWGETIYNAGTLNIINNIIAGGSYPGNNCINDGGTIATDINNLIEENGTGGFECGTPVSTADPLLGPLGDNGGSTHTMALLAGSPAIDTGDDTACAAAPVDNLDQRGVARPQSTGCDIGAYELGYFTLTVDLAGTGSGDVSGEGIACGADCTESYFENTVITLTASTDTGSSFGGWSGDLSGSTNPVTIAITADTAVTATFVLDQYELSVSLNGTGNGSVTSDPAGINCGGDCSETLDYGTVVTLTAMADTGSTFTSWSGACSGTGGCVVTMDEAKIVTATFTLEQYEFSVSLGGTGSGAITSDPAGIDCDTAGGDCTETYDYGTVVTLTATAEMGSAFMGWSGACSNATGDCVVTMDETKLVTATFTLEDVEYLIFLPLVSKQ